jgi:hypothetical protein
VWHPNTWDVAKRFLHDEAVATARGRPCGQFGQLPKADCRLHLGHPKVGALVLHKPSKAAGDIGLMRRQRLIVILPMLRV